MVEWDQLQQCLCPTGKTVEKFNIGVDQQMDHR